MKSPLSDALQAPGEVPKAYRGGGSRNGASLMAWRAALKEWKRIDPEDLPKLALDFPWNQERYRFGDYTSISKLIIGSASRGALQEGLD
jgi:hypothetical protein